MVHKGKRASFEGTFGEMGLEAFGFAFPERASADLGPYLDGRANFGIAFAGGGTDRDRHRATRPVAACWLQRSLRA